MENTYSVEGMHCGSCTQKVTTALERVPGVTRATVTLAPPLARVDMRAPVQTSALREAVAHAGDYRLSEMAPDLQPAPASEPAAKESLYPLFLIVAYIGGCVLLIEATAGRFELHRAMQNFMAGFFLVFSFFKLLDLRGFSDAYRSYDVLARGWPAWGWIYPFVELALGVAYLLGFLPTVVNGVTLVLMLVGAVGVLRALLRKNAIRCACLGTALNLPMTKVTLVEDLGMAAMAAVMLALPA